MKDEIKTYLNTIPSIYLPDALSALEEIFRERKQQFPPRLGSNYDELSDEIEDKIDDLIDDLEYIKRKL